MGFSLSDLDPTYSKGALGGAINAVGLDYLINPFLALGNDALAYIGDELKDWLTPDIDYSDRKLNARGPTGSRRIIYGEARVGGQLIYIEDTGADDRVLHMVVALAGHALEEIGDVFIDDVVSTDPKFSGKLQIYKQAATGLNIDLAAHLSSQGITDYKYTNIAYVYCVFTYDDEVYAGQPRITANVKGKNNIYDPRTMSTGYTQNGALCMLDFMRNHTGIADEFIDLDSWSDAADIADEAVAAANGSTEPRFALNGTILNNGKSIDTLGRMSLNSGINPYRQLGIWGASPQVYTAPAVDAIIDENDIISDISITTGLGKQDKVNTIKGTYIDSATNFEAIEFPSLQTPTYLTEDKEILEQSIDYQLVNSGTQCRRLSKIKLEQSRRGQTVSFTGRYRLLKYSIGDRVKFNYSSLGWGEKVFRVMSRKTSPTSGVQFLLREDDPAIYSWEEGDALETFIPPFLNLPDPNIVRQPTAFAVAEELYQANTQAAVKARASFSWTLGDNTAQHHELEGSYEGGPYRVLSSYIVGSSFKFDDLQVGSWLFRVRAVNSIGAKSPYTTIAYSILGKTEPPSDVTGFKGTIRPFGIELSWDAVPDLDVNEYEIRQGLSWDAGTKLQRLSALNWAWETRPTGTERLFIKAIDTSGNYSLHASVAQITILAPKSPAPVNARVIDNTAVLTWSNATTSFNIDKYEVRKGSTFESSSLIVEVSGTGWTQEEDESGTYTYWIRGIDVNGNAGTAASVTANVDEPPDFVLQSDADMPLGDATAVNMVETIAPGVTWDDNTVTWDTNAVTWDESTQIGFVGPANTTETWNEHFEKLPGYVHPLTWDDNTTTWDSNTTTFDEGYQTIKQLQINNGFNAYLQPTPSSASIEVVRDYQGVLSLSRIQLTPDVDIIAGAPTVQYTISYSDDGISYTDTVGTSTTGINFRYVKVRVDITSTSELDLLRENSLRVKLDVKLKTDAGRITISGAGGTPVLFNKAFVDIQSITVSANGTTALQPVYDFTDTPNPTGFDVYLFDNNGVEQSSGEVSWNVRGV